MTQIQVHPVCLETQLRRVEQLVRGVVVVAESHVLLCAITLVVTAVDTKAQVVADRATPGDAVSLRKLVGEFRMHQHIPVVGGSSGEIADRPGNGVPTVQRALRTTRDFHPLQVEHIGRNAVDPERVDTIDIGGDRQVRDGLPRESRADAAYGRALTGLRALVLKLQAGNQLLQVIVTGHAEFFNHLVAERRHGDRYVEQVLFTFLGRHDYLLDDLLAGIGVAGLAGEDSRCREHGGDGCADAAQ